MNFLHNYLPDPIFLEIGPISLRWYGLLISLALLVCLFLVLRLAKKRGFNSDQIYDLAFWSVLGGLFGARLYEVFILNWSYYSADLSAIVKIWEGGLAIHGAIIGGVMAVWFWAKINRQDFWQLADLIAVALPLGQAIGRWGNYFNQELFGQPTNWPIGLPIAANLRPLGLANFTYFQPTFLYESLLNLFLFLLLLLVIKKGKTKNGAIFILYLLGYAIIRFFMEFLRLDPTPLLGPLRWPQFVSLLIFFLAISLLFRRKIFQKN